MVQDDAVEVVSIATPPSLQSEIAIAVLRIGKPVFCEKPLATSRKDAFEMTCAAGNAGVANMVDFEFPEVGEWQQAKALIEGGSIGDLRHVAVTWNVETYANRNRIDSWKTRAEHGGGTLSTFVSHAFHYLEWIAGRIREVSARLFRLPGDDRSGDSLVSLALQFESGASGTVSVSSAAFPGSGHKVEFYGETGAVWLENTTQDYVRGFRLLHGTRSSGRMKMVRDSGPGGGPDGRVEAVSRLVRRFADWIETGKPSTPCFRTGLRVQELLDAARRSNEAAGRAQDIPANDANLSL
jgi:predicted dehydrogenase